MNLKFLLIAFSLLSVSFSVSAKERIISFISEIQVQKDASLIVKETIKVKSEGEKIKRGIYREFPTKYIDKHGLNFNTTFDIQKVLRDGKVESFHSEKLSNGLRVYFGRSDVFLDEGIYTYTLQYKTNRQIGYFEKFDELYWNVTGNGWDFEIEKVKVKITLPNQTSFLKSSGYTGKKGSSEGAYKQVEKTFETTRVLHPREGFTVAVSFPKGIVYQPTKEEIFQQKFEDNKMHFVSFLFLLLAFFFFYRNWKKVGRDPLKQPIYPRFYPPRKMSPTDMRYILKRVIDKKSYAASLVNLAVKGWLTIKKTKSEYTLYKARGRKKVSLAEKVLFKGLLEKRNEVLLDQKNHSTIGKAIRAFKKSVKKSHTIIYYKNNISYLWKGILLSIVALSFSFSTSSSDDAGVLSFWFIFWSIGCFFLLKKYVSSLKTNGFFANFFFTLFALPFFIGWGLGVWGFLSLHLDFILLISLLIVVLNLTFIELMSAPTIAGQRATEEIEGFKLYLKTAEKLRLEGLHPPEITPEIFEKYLPYAIALDVENAWSKNFMSELKLHGIEAPEVSNLAWINSDIPDLSKLSDSMSSGLSSQISSSSYAPGTSSGSSGGGFSGGGSGGGGGGGGW